MTNTRVARRYAEALLDAATDGKIGEEIAGDIDRLSRLLKDSRDLSLLIKSPVVKRDLKRRALRAALDGRFNVLTLEFIDLVTEKGREALLPAIIGEFRRLRDAQLGIVTLELSAVADLTDDQTRSLRERFESLMRKKVRVVFSIDSALKGGFRARVGDTVFDGSIRRQLELLRQRFAAGDSVN